MHTVHLFLRYFLYIRIRVHNFISVSKRLFSKAQIIQFAVSFFPKVTFFFKLLVFFLYTHFSRI
uniref:Uncharacterized protein n=1 Tax=Heterorhabditis bacteriophora TaxID=37862 RepID=A0A1I7WFP5_HETBA